MASRQGWTNLLDQTTKADQGLVTNRDKCEVIPAAGTLGQVRQEDFPGMKTVANGNFKLLGTAIGEHLAAPVSPSRAEPIGVTPS